MAGSSDPDVGSLLTRASEGDEGAVRDLLPLVYRELHRAAHRLLARERAGQTLQTTALLHEAWLRLDQGSGATWTDRKHYVQIAARAMRQILVDRALARRALKRGGGRRAVSLDADASSAWESDHANVLAIHEALEALGRRDEQLVQIVELRFFAGMTIEETARALELTPRKVSLGWSFARGWLKRELGDGVDRDG